MRRKRVLPDPSVAHSELLESEQVHHPEMKISIKTEKNEDCTSYIICVSHPTKPHSYLSSWVSLITPIPMSYVCVVNQGELEGGETVSDT